MEMRKMKTHDVGKVNEANVESGKISKRRVRALRAFFV